MRLDVITLFPEAFPGTLGIGVLGRALERDLFRVVTHDPRRFADPPHRQVDDEPFGGGAGMVLKPEPLWRTLDDVEEQFERGGIARGPVVFLTPQGEPLRHARAAELASGEQMTMLCGRYEAIDERVREHRIDLEISIGDYVLTGGEVAAMVVIEALVRLIPGVLGDPDSAVHESFSTGLLDHPHYTRPASFRGMDVPEILRSGNHAEITRWRRGQALEATARRRPDLLEHARLSDDDRTLLQARQAPDGGDDAGVSGADGNAAVESDG